MALGQGVQHIGVDDHRLGLIEGAHAVLDAIEVDGYLAADGGVHLGQHRGGDIVKVDAPHVGGGGKARQIPYHAAAHSHHAVGAGKAVFQHHAA